MDTSIILALTTVSACLPSLATVRLQRKEHHEQTGVLAWSGLIAIITIIGAIKYEPLMWLGVALMVMTYLFFLFAPMEIV